LQEDAVVPIPSTDFSLLCDLTEGAGRDGAWAVFQARYRGVILGWCLRRGLPADGAEDLAQDVLLKLFQRLPRYRHDPQQGQFRGWLKAVVNNAATDFWRRQRRRPERGAVGGTAFLERLGDLAGPEAAGELSGAIEDHARTTTAAVLERVRAKLKETTWQAFYQTMVERRPAAEVAAELNLSVATVYKANYRVKQMLLQEYGHVEATGGDPDPLPGPGDARESPP
jgi:RNA polymerase sigma-70 factor (ECF subfamily)